MTRTHRIAGRVYDPVFIFMVVAVVLAVGSSIALRCVTNSMGPSAAQAVEPDLQQQSQNAFTMALPSSGPHAAAGHNHSN